MTPKNYSGGLSNPRLLAGKKRKIFDEPSYYPVAFQQTHDAEPVLVYCWPSVVDGGPAINLINLSIYNERKSLIAYDRLDRQLKKPQNVVNQKAVTAFWLC